MSYTFVILKRIQFQENVFDKTQNITISPSCVEIQLHQRT